jgi:hypothetical protein
LAFCFVKQRAITRNQSCLASPAISAKTKLEIPDFISRNFYATRKRRLYRLFFFGRIAACSPLKDQDAGKDDRGGEKNEQATEVVSDTALGTIRHSYTFLQRDLISFQRGE